MPKSGATFVHKSFQDRTSVARLLSALTEGLASGHLVLAAGDQTLTLAPEGRLTVLVEASHRGRSRRLSLKVRWTDPGAAPDVSPDPLRVETGTTHT
jgi:amphi-Trp domain-containing protein